MTWASRLSLVSALVLVLALSLSMSPGRAWADTFYTCEKKGSLNAYVNEPELKKYRKDGWRCRTVFQSGGQRDTAPTSKGTAKGSSSAKTSTPPPSMTGGGNAISDAHKSTRDEDRVRALLPHVQAATSRYDIPIPFVLAVMKVESAFKPRALSSAGAQGLM